MLTLTPRPVIAACLLALAIAPVHAQQGAKNGEWPTYGGDLGNSRYSALDQVNANTSTGWKLPGGSRRITSDPAPRTISKARH